MCNKNQLEVLQFEVPVGDLRHVPLVIKMTSFVTIAALVLLVFKMRSHRFTHEKTT